MLSLHLICQLPLHLVICGTQNPLFLTLSSTLQHPGLRMARPRLKGACRAQRSPRVEVTGQVCRPWPRAPAIPHSHRRLSSAAADMFDQWPQLLIVLGKCDFRALIPDAC